MEHREQDRETRAKRTNKVKRWGKGLQQVKPKLEEPWQRRHQQIKQGPEQNKYKRQWQMTYSYNA